MWCRWDLDIASLFLYGQDSTRSRLEREIFRMILQQKKMIGGVWFVFTKKSNPPHTIVLQRPAAALIVWQLGFVREHTS